MMKKELLFPMVKEHEHTEYANKWNETSGLVKVVKSLKRIDYDFAHNLFKTFEFHACISVYLILTPF